MSLTPPAPPRRAGRPLGRQLAGAVAALVVAAVLDLEELVIPPVLAQTVSPPAAAATTDSAAAEALYLARRWQPAAEAFAALTRGAPRNAQYWLRYGQALDNAGRRADALPALQRALALGASPPAVRYRLAKAYAARGDTASALRYLGEAADSGFAQWEVAHADSDLAKLAGHPRYAAALRRVEANRFPCRADPAVRQFDFWLGDWSVRIGGTEVGTNRVHAIVDRCALLENWESPGQTGKSINYYEPHTRRWRQIFIFDSGQVHDYTGEWDGQVMRFTARVPRPGGTLADQRMTFFPAARDSVRQLIEQSVDGGRTYQATFDAMYVRRVP